MVNINNREWNELSVEDIEAAVASEEESFYFEFKEDKVDSKKIVEEISALANTYGGYIFLGVSDEKEIIGCSKWNEQSIHAMIHDALSPTPSFDVKKFVTANEKVVFVIKIEQGSNPPYITSKGKIYERLSSGSFAIKDSTKLTQMYYQRESELKRIEEKLTIDDIKDSSNNIFGYLDLGFSLKVTNSNEIWKKFVSADLKQVSEKLSESKNTYSISSVGHSIVISIGAVNNPNANIIANLHNFMEIMGDGSVKLRILLTNNDGDEHVNVCWIISVISIFREIYQKIFGENFTDRYLYAHKYERLTVLRQFSPVIVFDGPQTEEINNKFKNLYDSHIKNYGKNWIVSGDRVPKNGLNVLDKRYFSRMEIEYDSQNVIEELFRSAFAFLGYIDLEEIADGETGNNQ